MNNMPNLSDKKQEILKGFDDEINRLVTKSLLDSSCKPLTELKAYVSSSLDSYALAIAEVVEGMPSASRTECENEHVICTYDLSTIIRASISK